MTALNSPTVIQGTNLPACDTETDTTNDLAPSLTVDISAPSDITAATIKKIATINIAATRAASFDAEKISLPVTATARTIDSSDKKGVLNVKNLETNAKIGLVSTTQDMTAKFLTNALPTADTSLSPTAASTPSLSSLAGGNFAKVAINNPSTSTTTNKINFASDTLAGAASIDLTAKFATTGEKIGFSFGSRYIIGEKDKIKFVDTGNTQKLSPDAVTAKATTGEQQSFASVNNKLTLSAQEASQFSGKLTHNIEHLAITGGSPFNVNLANFGPYIKTITLDIPSSTSSLMYNVADNFTLNIGDESSPVFSSYNYVTISNAELGSSINVNLFVGEYTNIISNAKTMNLHVSSNITSLNQSIEIRAGTLHNLKITGGNAGSTLDLGHMYASIQNFDASDCASAIKAYSNYGSGSGIKFKGSITAKNDFTTGPGDDTLIGGAASDTFDAKDGYNAITLHHNGSTESNTVKFSSVNTYGYTQRGYTQIKDFNPGTAITAVDKIQFASHIDLVNSADALVKAGESVCVQTVSNLDWTFMLSPTTNLISYTGVPTTSDNLSSLSSRLIFQVAPRDNTNIPIVYTNSLDNTVHIALATLSGYKYDSLSQEPVIKVTDIAILGSAFHPVSINDIDVSDFDNYS
jgi:hypothetical protein